MIALFFLAAGLSAAGPRQATRTPAELAGAVGAILLRVEAPDEHARPALVREILALGALGDVAPCLFEVLGDERAPAGPEGQPGERLDDGQGALALEAALALGRSRLAAFLAEVRAEPGEPRRLAAALRIAGAGPFELETLRGLARLEGARSEGVEEAFQAALQALLLRRPQAYAQLPEMWMELPPELASAAVRSLAERAEPAAFRCLRGLLGRRAELDESLVVALGGLAHLVPPEEAEALAADLVGSDRTTSTLERAVATTLGRLEAPDAIPYLIERLGSGDAPLARAALKSLRAIARVQLPASASAWRGWYAREETWWLERCPELAQELEAGVAASSEVSSEVSDEGTSEAGGESHMDASALGALLRELSEHALHREELVPFFQPALTQGDVNVRVLACQALERIGARSAVSVLLPLLRQRSPEVVGAARTALVRITGVPWCDPPKAWLRELARRGFVPSE